MAVLGVDADGSGALRGLDGVPQALEALPRGAPVTVMIHGYRYAPGSGISCPHREIYAFAPDAPGITSWPGELGLDASDRLGIGFGWPAMGTLHGAYGRAGRAGRGLAELVATLRALAPDSRITLIGHSLGARVALQALPHLATGAVDAAILLAAAEFRAPAEAAADSPAGRAADILNVTSAENLLFDRGLGLILSGGAAPTLGRGLRMPRPQWTDLHLHDAQCLAGLAALGHPVAPPAARVCHWSAYTRPGVWSLYRALSEGALPAAHLRAMLPPEPIRRPRRPRLRFPAALPLPFARKASS